MKFIPTPIGPTPSACPRSSAPLVPDQRRRDHTGASAQSAQSADDPGVHWRYAAGRRRRRDRQTRSPRCQGHARLAGSPGPRGAVAPNVGDARVPSVAGPVEVAAFLHDRFPELAGRVAGELVAWTVRRLRRFRGWGATTRRPDRCQKHRRALWVPPRPKAARDERGQADRSIGVGMNFTSLRPPPLPGVAGSEIHPDPDRPDTFGQPTLVRAAGLRPATAGPHRRLCVICAIRG